MKHPRGDIDRATKRGVQHKFCTEKDIERALQHRRLEAKMKVLKLKRLSKENQDLLFDKWHGHNSVRPFIEQLLNLFDENKLSCFDFNFLKNWLNKKSKGKYGKADDQARNLAVLFSNKLGETMYTSVAPIMGLQSFRQVQRIKANSIANQCYMPGINKWVVEDIGKREIRPLQNGMDGTRVVRIVELYHGKYMIGEEFPTDPRLFPLPDQLQVPESLQQMQQYVLNVRQKNLYAAEAYSFNISDISGKLSDILLGSIPVAKVGVTANHILALMWQVEKYMVAGNIPLIGHSTDSASNSLGALICLNSPSTYYKHLDGAVYNSVQFLGLDRADFVFFAPILRNPFPSIAYPCWDHSGRTVLRNLMNMNIMIVAEVLPDANGFQEYKVASIKDLLVMKSIHPGCSVKYSDITPHVRQNCDATSRVLTRKVIADLKVHVPSSEATQLYLLAATFTHEPFRNSKFGSPPQVVRSLWAGLMIWRRWRRYIQLQPCLRLDQNFISRSHYMTEELLVHAGINHQLAIYHAFPHLSINEYSLRNSGNRGLESIHGTFRGGTTSLPITSANLSFQEFLSKMNSMMQISSAMHNLQQVQGCPIVATKKKRVTQAPSTCSCDDNYHDLSDYTKPLTYSEFLAELGEACNKA